MKIFLKSFFDITKFFKIKPHIRPIVFYSENNNSLIYFKGIIDELLLLNIKIFYVTSALNDTMLLNKNSNIKSFFIGNETLKTIFFKIFNSKLMVLTMPDLNSFHIKRSAYDTKYIYIPHNILSIHMVFKKKAFNNYDYFFCAGPHHNSELNETEKIYKLNEIKKINFGYNKIDMMNKKFKTFTYDKNEKKIIIAPTWGKNSILEKIGLELIAILQKTNLIIIIRPHPDTITNLKSNYYKIKDKFYNQNNIIFEEENSNLSSYYESTLMISDWSGAAFEYAFGLEKPVLFIDVEKKINNTDFIKYKSIPLEVQLRDEIGKVVKIDDIKNINQIIFEIIRKKDEYRNNIILKRKSSIYNFGNSSKIGADYIFKLIS